MKILPKKFYQRNVKIVAIDLLGKLLVRKIGNKRLIAKIIETEAYFGKEDPASRASIGFPKYVINALYGKVGLTLIYMVHANWLLNITAHEKNEGGAVLIRAVEPINFNANTSGPGKLTKAMKINKKLHGIPVYKKSELMIFDNKEKFEIESSKRIGVRKDLNENLRFYIKNNKWVSKL